MLYCLLIYAKEYLSNANQICDHLTSKAFFIEFFINEHPDAIQNNIVDIDLLRKIKDEF